MSDVSPTTPPPVPEKGTQEPQEPQESQEQQQTSVRPPRSTSLRRASRGAAGSGEALAAAPAPAAARPARSSSLARSDEPQAPTHEANPKTQRDADSDMQSHAVIAALARPEFAATRRLLASPQAVLALPPARAMAAYGSVDADFFGRHVFFLRPESVQDARNITVMEPPAAAEDLHDAASPTDTTAAPASIDGLLPDHNHNQPEQQQQHQLLSILGMRALVFNQRLFLLGPMPPEDELVQRWNAIDDPPASRLQSLWDLFPNPNPAMTMIPSIELSSDQITTYTLPNNTSAYQELVENGSSHMADASPIQIRLLMIRRPIMEDDLDHQSLSGSPRQTKAPELAHSLQQGTPLQFEHANEHYGTPELSTVATASISAPASAPVTTLPRPKSPALAGAAAGAAAAFLSIPSQFLGTINQFTALPTLFVRPDYKIADPGIAALSDDPAVIAFLNLVNDSRAEIFANHVHRFLTDFGTCVASHHPVTGAHIKAKSSATTRASDRSDAIAKLLFGFMDTMQSLLVSLRFVRVLGDAYIASVLDGLETYTLGRHHVGVYGIVLMEEQVNDHVLASRLSVIGISPTFGLADLGLDMYGMSDTVSSGLSDAIFAAGIELMRFERALASAIKIAALIRLHAHLVEFVENFNASEVPKKHSNETRDTSSNADTLLGLLIYTVIRTHPTHLLASLRYTQKFRYPSRLDGQASYCLVNLEAAISFLTTLDLTILQTPEDVLEGCLPPSPGAGRMILLPWDESKILRSPTNKSSPVMSMPVSKPPSSSASTPSSPSMLPPPLTYPMPMPAMQPTDTPPKHQPLLRNTSPTHANSTVSLQPKTSLISGIAAMSDDVQKVTSRLSQLLFRAPPSTVSTSPNSTTTTSPTRTRGDSDVSPITSSARSTGSSISIMRPKTVFDTHIRHASLQPNVIQPAPPPPLPPRTLSLKSTTSPSASTPITITSSSSTGPVSTDISATDNNHSITTTISVISSPISTPLSYTVPFMASSAPEQRSMFPRDRLDIIPSLPQGVSQLSASVSDNAVSTVTTGINTTGTVSGVVDPAFGQRFREQLRERSSPTHLG